MYHLTEETKDDWWEVEALYDLCFTPGREALSSYRLRDGIPPVPHMSLVARDDGGILSGAIRYWPVMVVDDDARYDALLLGPVAVHPTRQGEGLGGFLIRESLSVAREGGVARVMLVGDAPYYARFGFSRLDSVEMPPPTNPDRVLAYRLQDGAWSGVQGRVTPVTTSCQTRACTP
ncbi:N-acetyltransferase [Aliiroseovarius sediminis]|uniref:GNAT family N-acetyltransferase n=1 Tax=Aliiroseovarius sediminis TaxID=2925839 RepID=UPI001F58CEF4|nr:N-acetyltransferase [uncultured Aliiroseovarius sp.]MCI2394518.1 N-acetyltransferase [Aliiroseovarius sediminis]